MPAAKIAVTLDQKLLLELDRLVKERRFPNRSRAVQEALREKLQRMEQGRLAGMREAKSPRGAGTRRSRPRGRPQIMARILRGDIVWATLDPVRGHEQGGTRPIVVISHDVFNRSGTVIALAITSQPPKAGFPLTLEITTAKLPKRSWVKVSQIRTLSTDRLGTKISRVSQPELDQLVDGLVEIIGNP